MTSDAAALQGVMTDLLNAFTGLSRLSGTAEAERGVDALMALLAYHGLTVRKEICRLWLSDPLEGGLTLPRFPDWRCAAKTRSFSASRPDGVSAELYDDGRALAFVPDDEQPAWEAAVRGRIVVADQGFEDYVQRLMHAGAAGLVHIWGSAEEALHEETVGPIWGSPVPDDAASYPTLPVISINQRSGAELRVLMAAGPLTARLTTRLDERLAQCGLPVVEIGADLDEFVLLSSHYDAWHEGLTDNATGNALCLAVAAHFAEHRATLKRGLRIAWWPGHSNGRYGGSAWYADKYRFELQQRCIAHINVDSPGCRDALRIVINASGAENTDFLNRAVNAVTGRPAQRIAPIGKGGDQSFWGCGIPLHFALREEPEKRVSQSPGSGGGWWWHTENDTRDKVDDLIQWRDCAIHLHWLAELLTAPDLPFDAPGYLRRLQQELVLLQRDLDPAFSLSRIVIELAALRSACLRRPPEHRTLIRLLGILHRARYMSTDDFHQDKSYHGGAFPGLQLLRHHLRARCRPRTWLMLETQYRRQHDRILDLLRQGAALWPDDGFEQEMPAVMPCR
ncbi:M28 family peptidase [Martelella alba]|uniref:Carboxypeptidase Q n=1 Tax=Martelella alba TaxID=2590451 RepID=A0ABY2SHV5_9HYPH|nr:M28 family peptidase [Martelella alba]TKI04606.1 M28 family peptidase [Martelella alba]